MQQKIAKIDTYVDKVSSIESEQISVQRQLFFLVLKVFLYFFAKIFP